MTHEKGAAWRKVKKLGSLLGDEEDIDGRMALATVQFKALEKLWGRPQCTSLRARMRAYNAFVLPVLLYNASTWGVSQSLRIVRKLDVFHRRHLRRVMGVRWPYVVSNKFLYACCGVESIGLILRRLRWNLFGHVLRLPLDTPAQIAMEHYCNTSKAPGNKQRGRAQTTLPVVLFYEYHKYKQDKRPSKYRQEPDVALRQLRKLASDRKGWADVAKNDCRVMQ
jgi:hypothetical protein